MAVPEQQTDSGLELAFVLAPLHDLQFVEIVGALRAELDALGVRSSAHVGRFPEPSQPRVYVLAPPNEYFTKMHGLLGPPPEVLARTILICGERPGTASFDHNVKLAELAGAVFDINRVAVREFRRQRISARYLQLGWTSRWDDRSRTDRDIDVIFTGAASDRRLRALASYARTLNRRQFVMLFPDASPLTLSSSSSLGTEHDRWELLRRAKIVLNLHRDDSSSLEWTSVTQAICSGAVVVSEDSTDYDPLLPGKHLLMGDAGSLHLLCEWLLDDAQRLAQIREAGREVVRDQIRLADSARELAAVAAALSHATSFPDPRRRFFTQSMPEEHTLPFFARRARPSGPDDGDQAAASLRRALKHLRLEVLDLQRDQARLDYERTTGSPVPDIEWVAQTFSFEPAEARVSVLTALYNHADYVADAIDSVAASWDCSIELIIVDDGSVDGSEAVVRDWMLRHEDVPAILMRHPTNQGLAASRNDAIGLARADLCFVLDSDNEVYPHCLRRLVLELDRSPSAGFAYGTLERFTGKTSTGLLNTVPFDATRLRTGNYIDAMAMMRTEIVRDMLGGYSRDRRLHGWEDYGLWCSFASAGCYGIRVPEVLARYRDSETSMRSLTDISFTDAYAALIEANPELMAGIEPPD